jgi:hypothetical protein
MGSAAQQPATASGGQSLHSDSARARLLNALSEFRLIPRVETFPAVVSFSQTTPGKIAMLAAFALGMRFFLSTSVLALDFTFLLALMTFMPEYRHLILAVAPIILVVMQHFQDPLFLGLNLAVIALGIFLYWCAMRWPKSRFGRRPVACLLAGFTMLILMACAARPPSLAYSVLWNLVALMATYVWFIAYALTDRNSTPGRDLTLELASLRPLWGSSDTPFPKGAAYLRRIEARNPEQLAIVQLKGLKLLAWAILLSLFSSLVDQRFLHRYLRIPTSAQALAMSVRGSPVAWHLRWESQILFFFEITLGITIFGHQVISFCRMAGFNALRNTYRPLSSTTIAEFFNRFYYYFKELLVDFFFFPTFLRYFKGHKQLRTVFATFMAAAFGNSFYHLTRDWKFIQHDGLWKALASYQVLFFYSLILATALSISQLRKRGPKPKGLVRGRLVPVSGVLLFYCLLSVFIDEGRSYPLAVHLKYLASLFFIQF